MSLYGDFLAEDARLRILQLLRKSGEQPLNHEVLTTALQSMGVRISKTQVRNELRYLEEVRAVTLVDAGHLLVATLTERGDDAATGLSRLPGVMQHVPGAAA